MDGLLKALGARAEMAYLAEAESIFLNYTSVRCERCS